MCVLISAEPLKRNGFMILHCHHFYPNDNCSNNAGTTLTQSGRGRGVDRALIGTQIIRLIVQISHFPICLKPCFFVTDHAAQNKLECLSLARLLNLAVEMFLLGAMRTCLTLFTRVFSLCSKCSLPE
jgi:hypothetical protein